MTSLGACHRELERGELVRPFTGRGCSKGRTQRRLCERQNRQAVTRRKQSCAQLMSSPLAGDLAPVTSRGGKTGAVRVLGQLGFVMNEALLDILEAEVAVSNPAWRP